MENKNNYELSFWLSSELNEKEAEIKFNDLLKELEKLGSLINVSQLPQLKPLAYPIKKEKTIHENAYFGFVQFSLEKNLITSLKKSLNLNNEIIRFLIIHKEIKQKIKIPSGFFKKSSLNKSEKEEIRSKEKPEKPEKPEKEISLEELDEKLNEILKK
jgi:ribosomal protein S6